MATEGARWIIIGQIAPFLRLNSKSGVLAILWGTIIARPPVDQSKANKPDPRLSGQNAVTSAGPRARFPSAKQTLESRTPDKCERQIMAERGPPRGCQLVIEGRADWQSFYGTKSSSLRACGLCL